MRFAARLAGLVVALLVVTVPGLRAQSVEGGGSFEDAASLADGRFKDTILPDETSFYAIELGTGQKMKVQAQVLEEPGAERKNILPGYPKLTLYGPDRVERGSKLVAFIPERDSKVMRLRTRTVGVGEWEPGVYFVTLTLGDQGDALRRREYDVELQLLVKGAAQPSQTPTATPSVSTPIPTAEPSAPPALPDPPSPIPWYLGSFVVGGVVGAAGRVLLARRRRA